MSRKYKEVFGITPPEYMAKHSRINKPKDQIAFEMKQKQETARKRKFVEEVLFPLLQEHTKSVREAKMFCKVIQNDILTTFNEGMRAPLSTLKIEQKFEKDNREGATAVRALVKAFKDTPINETLELLDGMPNAIDAALTYEDRDRLMKDLAFHDGIITATNENFDKLLKETPECNDFRQLADGTWVAYSKKVVHGGITIHTQGETIYEALKNLHEALKL